MSDFNIDVVDEITIIKANIVIATHRDVEPLWDQFENNLIFRQKKIIIDLSFCNNVDSTFMGMIIKIFRRVKEKNGQLILVFPKHNSIQLFSMSNLDKVILCYNTLQEALNYFGLKGAIQTLRSDSVYLHN